MAARLEFYSLPDGHHPEWYGDDALTQAQAPTAGADHAGAPEFLGFVSAADADEQALFDLLGALADDLPAVDARTQGYGYVSPADMAAAVPAIEALRSRAPAGSEAEQGWVEVVGSCLARSAADANGLGWHMRYDRSGTPDDGADEFATAWSVVLH